jgi:hypothetical protein
MVRISMTAKTIRFFNIPRLVVKHLMTLASDRTYIPRVSSLKSLHNAQKYIDHKTHDKQIPPW